VRQMPLPPGQRAIDHFPRFGPPASASRLPSVPSADFAIQVRAAGTELAPISTDELARLPRRDVISDFHCVTTWSCRALHWSGYAFRSLYRELLLPRAPACGSCAFVELKGLDGYGTCIALEDLLAEDVLLADRLNDAPLSLDHGAPIRLVAPSLYGYKNIKHLSLIEPRADYRRTFVERQTRAHPRGRVALEERGQGLPGSVYRVIYRALLPLTLWSFQRAEKRSRRA
jgi:DMSO/TMAO reductase YedYZ molybdopterin-dependent catalytic subunit